MVPQNSSAMTNLDSSHSDNKTNHKYTYFVNGILDKYHCNQAKVKKLNKTNSSHAWLLDIIYIQLDKDYLSINQPCLYRKLLGWLLTLLIHSGLLGAILFQYNTIWLNQRFSKSRWSSNLTYAILRLSNGTIP